ncbi:MAG TPA: DUF3592 domain-containing protein [Cellvibrionaceae bacterium]
MTKLFNGLNCFLLVIGALLVLMGGYIFLKSEKVKAWPTTTGVIITSEIVKTTVNGSRRFLPEVTYEYFVASTGYKGTNIGIGKESHESYAKQVTGNYPAGKDVIVYYNIKDPSEAFLEVGITPIIYYFLGIGFVLILTSISMVYFKNSMLDHFEKMMRLFQKTKT